MGGVAGGCLIPVGADSLYRMRDIPAIEWRLSSCTRRAVWPGEKLGAEESLQAICALNDRAN